MKVTVNAMLYRLAADRFLSRWSAYRLVRDDRQNEKAH